MTWISNFFIFIRHSSVRKEIMLYASSTAIAETDQRKILNSSKLLAEHETCAY